MADRNPAELPVGTLFQGRYEIVRRLKTGGMGAIYEAVHVETRRRRALKVMLPSSIAKVEHRARFKMEATVAAEIRSEHIVETLDAGVDAETGTPFLVMELLEGEDLAALLERRTRLPAPEVIALLRQAASALDRIHAAGVVHRDVKPENLFVTRADDGSPRLKVLDFGISKSLAGAAAGDNTQAVGTPLYVPPEQIRGGALGPASDNYALAHVAYRLLVGEHYWQEERERLASAVALMMKVMSGLPEAASARAARAGVRLPPAFDDWFAKAAAGAPDARFASASEQVDALARALDVQAPVTASQPPLALVLAERPSSSSPEVLAPQPSVGARGALRGPPSLVLQIPAARPRRRRAILVVVMLASLLAIGAWAAVGYKANDEFDDRTREIVAAAARVPWREPGHYAVKLDQMGKLSYRLIEVGYYPPGRHLSHAAFASLGVSSRPELDAAYYNALVEGFVRPTRRLLEEKLRATPVGRHPDDGDVLRLYQTLGAPVVLSEDRKWASEHLATAWLEEIRRTDASVGLGAEADFLKRLRSHTNTYLGFVHDGVIKPEPLDRALIDRLERASHR